MRRRAFVFASLATTAFLSSAHARHLGATNHFESSDASVRLALGLPGTFTIGARDGDVTLIEFLDYNCHYCKISARQFPPLLRSESKLKAVLVNFAVMGSASAQAAAVAIAVSRKAPGKYLVFRRDLLARRGTIDAEKALDVAKLHGLDVSAVERLAGSESVAAAVRAAAALGGNINPTRAPFQMIGRHVYAGELTLEQQRAAVAQARTQR